MKRISLAICALLSIGAVACSQAFARKSPKRHFVRPFVRKDGTMVRGHMRGSGVGPLPKPRNYFRKDGRRVIDGEIVTPDSPSGPADTSEYDNNVYDLNGNIVAPSKGSFPVEEEYRGAPNTGNKGLPWDTEAQNYDNEASDAQPESAPKPIYGLCADVMDGDTITFQHGNQLHSIRLYGIKAPSLDQPFGQQSRTNALKLLMRKRVTIYPMARDAEGVLRAAVYVNSRKLWANAEQIKAGLATCDNLERTDNLRSLEKAAQENKVGLWAGPSTGP